ncbi:hypothetical protein [uncultured Lacinutrix sp.]|uniref:hypothetical protein n=1 Tax=uncultured Lacinutrix sp. TaxID=574032 RepID=UPI0026110170|nr:hypothetical protein [uncultured Lacinutrix sp.]
MRTIKKELYAIYKDKNHMGNERGDSKEDAIKSYLIAADLEDYIYNIELTNQYTAVIAINGIHHYTIKLH